MLSATPWKEPSASNWLVDEFMLRNGKHYPGCKLPGRYALRMPRACFYNARKLVLGSKSLLYSEGYAARRDLDGFGMFFHAWALDREGGVVDPTLAMYSESDADGYEYFGIVFPRLYLQWRNSRVLLDERGMYRLDVLVKYDSGFAPAFAEFGWKSREAALAADSSAFF